MDFLNFYIFHTSLLPVSKKKLICALKPSVAWKNIFSCTGVSYTSIKTIIVHTIIQ